METPNTGALAGWWQRLGVKDADITRAFRTFNADSPEFRAESQVHDVE
jgi:hypothetical protein